MVLCGRTGAESAQNEKMKGKKMAENLKNCECNGCKYCIGENVELKCDNFIEPDDKSDGASVCVGCLGWHEYETLKKKISS